MAGADKRSSISRLEKGLRSRFIKMRASVVRERDLFYGAGKWKWGAILLFIILNAALTISLRVEAIMTDVDNPCISSTQVCMTEMVKLFLAFLACLFLDAKGSVWQLLNQLEKAFVEEGADLLKLCVPAVLYIAQNNLQYVIETSPLFVIMYDCKVVTTALFYTHMLNRRFKKREWSSIIVLTVGIAMVQSAETDVHYHHASNFVGISAVIFACLTSGFAGVFFEKTLKDSNSSIWMINLELSMISSSLGMFTCLMEDTEAISARGFFSGYDRWVILVIVLQAMAGLSIALVVKLSDNVYKGFATGVSITIACFIDQLLFDNHVWTPSSLLGVMLIILSFAFFAFNQSPGGNHAGHGHSVASSGPTIASPAAAPAAAAAVAAASGVLHERKGSLDEAEDGGASVVTDPDSALVARQRADKEKDKDKDSPSPNRRKQSSDQHESEFGSSQYTSGKGHPNFTGRGLWGAPMDAANRLVDKIADIFSEPDYRRVRLASAHDKREK